jgi:hypothetical protein
MNNFQMRAFVRQLVLEAKKDKAKEPKKTAKETEEKKSNKKEDSKLLNLKKKLSVLKQYRDELQAAKFAEKTTETEVQFADLANFAKELEAIKTKGADLESKIDTRITELENEIKDAINTVKEMIGLVPKEGQEKMMGENKGTKNFTYTDASGKTKFVTADNIDQAKETAKKFGADPKTVKEKTAPLPIAPKK